MTSPSLPLSLSPEASPAELAQALESWFEPFDRIAVAFSGGVDSAVVADAAARSFGRRSVLENLWAVTGVGPAVSQRDRDDARRLATEIGIQHVWLETDEILDPDYQANLGRRCYFCKNRLYLRLHEWGTQNGHPTLVNGTNRDDLGDYRPGLDAAQEHAVRSPLVELRLDKSQVRSLAQLSNLHVADKPASPCLASRIAPGVRVTPERLAVIERAEAWLRGHGIPDLRVRWYENALLRVEVPMAWLSAAQDCLVGLRRHLIDTPVNDIPIGNIEIDPRGLVSGGLNYLAKTAKDKPPMVRDIHLGHKE